MTHVAAGRPVPPAGAPPEVVALGRELLAGVDALTDRLVDMIVAEDASYAGSAPTPREDLWRSCHDNLVRILSVLAGDAPGDPLDAPRETGHRRAEQGMPLESVLHAYRLGYRTIWDGLVALARQGPGGLEVLVETATTVWEIVDVFSSAVADAYRATEAQVLGRDARRREALVDALLDGRGADRAVAADAAAALELPEHGAFAVVVLEGTESGRTAAEALRRAGLRSGWRTRAGREVGIVALGEQPATRVCVAVAASVTVRAGVSPAVEGLAEVDVAHRLAETALRALPPGSPGVVELDARLPAALLVTAPDLAERLVRRSLGPVLDLDSEERDVLLETLRVWLDTGGSAGRTAQRVFCHRNTVLNRVRRLEALVGGSLEEVDRLVECSLALLAVDLLPTRPA